jgi:hypothetical protein
MESGNQRILDLIDKGTKVGFMSQTMRNFSEAGIAVQLMAFSDFPTETPEEKAETLRFIKENEPYWSTGGLGTFLLTGTSMIARDPEKFGLTTTPFEGADSTRALAFKLDTETGQRTALVEDADASFDEAGAAFQQGLGRPWAGGTDTLHSMIYYERYGRRFFKEDGLRALADSDVSRVDDDKVTEGPLDLNAVLVESPFNLQSIIENRLSFCDYLDKRLQVPAEPTYAGFRNWAAKVAPVPANPPTYWLTTGQNVVQIDKLAYRVLSIGSSKRVPVKELLAALPQNSASKMFKYLLELEQNGLIGFALRPAKKRLLKTQAGKAPPLELARRQPEGTSSGCHTGAGLVQLVAAHHAAENSRRDS